MNPPRQTKITAVVVTFNRKALLERCLSAIASQSRPPDAVLIVDNASTDGTTSWLSRWLPSNLPQAKVATLPRNTGGAGGFAEGLRLAIEGGAHWVWMMDDDAEPHTDALVELAVVATEPANVYGSLATSGAEVSWLTTLLGANPRTVSVADDVPAAASVQTLPFLGFMIHSDLVSRIGLPDAGFFIAVDDVEYCVRARRAGAEIVVAGKSRIEHPKSRPYEVRLPGYTLTALELPPWKRYYDTRNRILLARKYYGMKLLTHTIPGSFVRMAAALMREPRKLAQIKAFFAGLVDGLLGRKGPRHEVWGIK
jgi:GT2 family glycosyltransferase